MIKKPYIVYILAAIGLLVQFVPWLTESISWDIYYTSAFISLMAISIWFLLDQDEFKKRIGDGKYPYRFYKYMPVGMILCTLADFLLQQDFMIGMITFLLAHFVYIIAMSGIIKLDSVSL